MAPRTAARGRQQAWKARPEAGSALGLRIMIGIALLLGRRVLHLTLYPVTLYFVVVRRTERHASRRFLTAALGREATFGDVFRHFLTFARVTADRVFFLAGRAEAIPVRFHGAETVQALVDEGRGGVFLAAHMGSFEAARVIGPTIDDIVLRIVLDRQINRRLMARLEALNPAFAALIIDATGSSLDLALAIAEALERGEWIGLLADRHRAGDRTAPVRFFDHNATLPLGPFLVAAAREVPLVSMFCHYRRGAYDIHCEVLSEGVRVARRERREKLAELVQTFADRLATHARLSPYSWFNFFDFWEHE